MRPLSERMPDGTARGIGMDGQRSVARPFVVADRLS